MTKKNIFFIFISKLNKINIQLFHFVMNQYSFDNLLLMTLLLLLLLLQEDQNIQLDLKIDLFNYYLSNDQLNMEILFSF